MAIPVADPVARGSVQEGRVPTALTPKLAGQPKKVEEALGYPA